MVSGRGGAVLHLLPAPALVALALWPQSSLLRGSWNLRWEPFAGGTRLADGPWRHILPAAYPRLGIGRGVALCLRAQPSRAAEQWLSCLCRSGGRACGGNTL